MSTRNKILLGGATVWPLIYLPIFILLMIAWMAGSVWSADGITGTPNIYASPLVTALILLLAALHLLTAADTIAMMIFYTCHMINNRQLTGAEKITWALLLISTATLAMPIYFYTQIWRKGQTNQTEEIEA